MAKKPTRKRKSTAAEIQRKFDKMMKVAERKGQALGISGKDYLIGAIMGKYPKFDHGEIDREPD